MSQPSVPSPRPAPRGARSRPAPVRNPGEPRWTGPCRALGGLARGGLALAWVLGSAGLGAQPAPSLGGQPAPSLGGQPAPSPGGPLAPPLEAGEALLVTRPDGTLLRHGPVQEEALLGGLSALPWIRLEGVEWGAGQMVFKCPGQLNGVVCSQPKGHGKVDLPGALQAGCDLAILAWANFSAAQWRKDYGDGAARARLEDAFGPFLGNRMPAGEGLPVLDGAWVGRGGLLRASPAALMDWLLDPAQDEVVRRARRLALSAFKENFRPDAWWIVTAAAGPAEAPSAWAVGGNGSVLAVFHARAGKGREGALARFKVLMKVP